MLLTILLSLISLTLGGLLIAKEYQLRHLKQKTTQLEQVLSKQHREHHEVSIEFEKINQQPLDQSMLDKLTGLPCRKIFEDRTEQLISYSKRYETKFAVMLFDIDQLSVINSKLSYAVGDKLLTTIAQRLQGEVRQLDTVANFGGGKFILLFPQLEKGETAAYIAQRLQDAVIRLFNIDGQEIYIRASMGIAIYPLDGEDTSTLLKHAELALRQAKEQGGNRYQFYDRPTNDLGKREIALKTLINDADLIQHLSIHYDFYYHTQSKNIEFVKALPQLNHPEYGIVDYAEFAKIADNSNKMPEIGAWLLNHALVQFQKLHADSIAPKKIIINVSVKQIRHPSFELMLTKALQEHHVAPTQLILEINDNQCRVNVEPIESAITALSKMQVSIAVSIFGLGHFALQNITKIPINYLKIDARLINRLLATQENKFILNTLMNQASDMHIGIISEGVDSEEQKSLLMALGCDIMQGKALTAVTPS